MGLNQKTQAKDHIDAPPDDTIKGNYVQLFEGATFMPIDAPSRTEQFLQEVWKLRQATLVAFCSGLSEKEPALFQGTGLSDGFQTFLSWTPAFRRQFTEYPPFRIWLKQSLRAVASASAHGESGTEAENAYAESKLAELRRIIGRFYVSRSGKEPLKVPGTAITVERFDVDPLVAEVAPPTYQFPDLEKQHKLEEETAYKLPFFLEVATAALKRIRQSWPEAYLDFNKFVRTLVHVTDGDFRSCSAERYTGVIFLSADDATLFDVEESLIHEYGHQILYNLMELDQVVLDDTTQSFKLPWSGQERDFYGYFHAFYIYILLVCYFERLMDHFEKERERATERIADILRGLDKALPDFEASNNFTPMGAKLLEALKREVYQLEEKHKYIL